MIENLIHAKKITLSVRFNAVSIEMTCDNEYEAQVLFDDLVGRMKDGQEISICPGANGQSAEGEK